MDRNLKCGVFASVLLWPFLAAASAACFVQLPWEDPEDPFMGPYDRNHNWIGQGKFEAFGDAFLLVLAVYVAKFLIVRVPVRGARVYFFSLLVVASLPCIWLFVVVDWGNPHVFHFACWVYYPIGFWFIPTISFAGDTIAMRSPSLPWYFGRSCLELLMIGPWSYAWTFISFLFLGGGWI
jgi:hypothetical protein